MIISILSLFPEIFEKVFASSILGKAQKKGLVQFRYINIRDYSTDSHKSVDDKPYGGGVGMVMRVDVVERAIANVKCHPPVDGSNVKCKKRVILLDPKGKLFTQARARKYTKLDHLILVCGHYEGIDYRITHFVDEIVSIGKYILTGGEIPAMVITDSIIRLIPGVLSKREALTNESFNKRGVLEYPQFTRPPRYKNYQVPTILLSGNHQKIATWKKARLGKKSYLNGPGSFLPELDPVSKLLK